MIEQRSLYDILGWPPQFGIVLLTFAFILLIAPYLSDKDFGLFKIPAFSPTSKKWLRFVGPVVFIICGLSFAHLFPPVNGTAATQNINPAVHVTTDQSPSPFPTANPPITGTSPGATQTPSPAPTQNIVATNSFSLVSENTAFALVSTIEGQYTVRDNFVDVQIERATFSLRQGTLPRRVLNLRIAIAHYNSGGRWEPARYSEAISVNSMLRPTDTLNLGPKHLTISRAGISDIENYWLVGTYEQQVDREGQPPAVGTSNVHSAEMLISRKPTRMTN